MVTKVVIRDNMNAPLRYISKLAAFNNGKTYEFKPGVNVIVGENGCGKTTLMELIGRYLLVDFTECRVGMFRCNVNALYDGTVSRRHFLDGVDVYADYTKNTFRLSHSGEKESKQTLETFEDFGVMFSQKHSSTGEGVLVAINSLFSHVFGKEARLSFDYGQFRESDETYHEYVERHKVECEDEWTVLMDEPDRNLSLENIRQIKGILSFHKEHTQIIAVIHNPLLICALSKMEHIHFIEMTRGYVNKVRKQVKKIVK